MTSRSLFLILFSIFLNSSLVLPARAQSSARSHLTPAWFVRDVQRRAAWLPEEVKRLGVNGAYQNRWRALPGDVQAILTEMNIPEWQIALIPRAASRQDEILKQFRFMSDLAGTPPATAISRRAEQLLIFGGSAQLPTPGDNQTGHSLGAEGCTAAMSKYVIAQLKVEFKNELAGMPVALAASQSSSEMKSLFFQSARQGAPWLKTMRRPFAQLQASDISPGSIMIAEKPGGTHVFGWTRVPRGWGWSAGDKMAIGNTGLVQFGDRMILAQEYVTDNIAWADERSHNQHGPINGHAVVYRGGEVDLANPHTNVYAARGSDFIIVSFR